MTKKVLAIALLCGVISSPAWALFETNKELVATAKIPMEEAVRTAVKAFPGSKAVEAELGKEDNRTVFEVELIDANKKTQKVYVDAETGKTKIDK